MPPYASTGRHRTDPPGPYRRTRRAFVAVISVLAVVNVVLLGLRLNFSAGPAGRTEAVPLPTVSGPAPPITSSGPARSLAPGRAERQVRKPRPATPSPTPSRSATAVLLGPVDLQAALTGYCRATYGRLTVAVLTGSDGWQCARPRKKTHGIDMDAACRSLYGSPARADLRDDDDQQSWRCYRDGS